MAPALAYFDSSVLVKLYVEEPGSPQARRLTRSYRLLSSVLTSVEILSAVARRCQAGDLTRALFDGIVSRLYAERSRWNLIEVSPRVVQQAERLVQEQTVRALDALHISSALLIQSERYSTLSFATADNRQRDAAAKAGLRILWVDSAATHN